MTPNETTSWGFLNLTNWLSGFRTHCVISRRLCFYKAVLSMATVRSWLTVLPGNRLLRQGESWVLLALSSQDRYWFSSCLLFLFFTEKRQVTRPSVGVCVCVCVRFSSYLLQQCFHASSVCMVSISLYVAVEVSTRPVCAGCCLHAVAVSELIPSQEMQHLYTFHTAL